MMQIFVDLLKRMKDVPNHISPSAYDTAWVAWLYPEARDWVVNAQHPDGSWGSDLEYYQDRVISTLSAINAIAATSTNGHDLQRIERGIGYLERTIPCLPSDISDLIGFELLLPSLVNIGRNLGLKYDRIASLIEPEMPKYYQKLALIPQEMVYSPKTVVPYSLEFVGFEAFDKFAIPPLRSVNGSIHNSPSATAFVEIATQGSEKGRAYLDSLMERYNGTVPGFTPLWFFEIIWTLYHLSFNTDLKVLRSSINPLIAPILDAWTNTGVGVDVFMLPDPDDTALALKIFNELEIDQSPSVLETYEVGDHFQCFPLERNISLDVHIHIVEALKNAPDFPRRDEMLLKAVNVLQRHLKKYIADKWHVSPYYSTAHAIIALTDLADNLIEKQINWLLRTQQPDGSWTFYPRCPKAAIEETAHALLALMTVYEKKGSIPFEVIKQGSRYLDRHYKSAEELPALWTNKGLYNPYYIVEATILSVMAKYQTLRPKAIISYSVGKSLGTRPLIYAG